MTITLQVGVRCVRLSGWMLARIYPANIDVASWVMSLGRRSVIRRKTRL